VETGVLLRPSLKPYSQGWLPLRQRPWAIQRVPISHAPQPVAYPAACSALFAKRDEQHLYHFVTPGRAETADIAGSFGLKSVALEAVAQDAYDQQADDEAQRLSRGDQRSTPQTYVVKADGVELALRAGRALPLAAALLLF